MVTFAELLRYPAEEVLGTTVYRVPFGSELGRSLQDAFQSVHGVARDSECTRGQCGACLIAEGSSRGICSPNKAIRGDPGRCNRKGELSPGFKSDRTCCIHAEQAAIMLALRSAFPLEGSTLLFGRVHQKRSTYSGAPYCTICSKMALSAGISRWVLFHRDGFRVYNAADYNDLSFSYGRSEVREWSKSWSLPTDK